MSRVALLLALTSAAAAMQIKPPTLKARLVEPTRSSCSSSLRTHPSTGEAAALLAGTALLSVVEPAFAGDVSWVAPTKLVLGPLLSIGTIFFLLRVVLSWFPSYNLDEPPWSIVAIPTEPFLKPTRKVIPPVAGVDISPIVWVSILSFISEILTGPQGLLSIIAKQG